MNVDASLQFLRKIRAALGHPPAIRRRKPELFQKMIWPCGGPESAPALRNPAEMRLMLERFREEAGFLHLHVVEAAGVFQAAEFIRELARARPAEWGEPKRILLWKDKWLDRLNLAQELGGMGIPIHSGDLSLMSRSEFREAASLSCIGITSADYAIAESATLVLQTGPGRPRLVSLMPSIHVAVFPLYRILPSFQELVNILRPDPGGGDFWAIPDMTFISGPSKTADIEACMVHGAHGPREVYAVVMTDEEAGRTSRP
jgi:L-lactate dehydrogenase complex protein LldG